MTQGHGVAVDGSVGDAANANTVQQLIWKDVNMSKTSELILSKDASVYTHRNLTQAYYKK